MDELMLELLPAKEKEGVSLTAARKAYFRSSKLLEGIEKEVQKVRNK
jgi:hypothetical protein